MSMDEKVAEIIEEILTNKNFATKDDLKQVSNKLDKMLKDDGFKQLIAQVMLSIMPEFNERISKEIKSHLVALAEFVITNFKEKG